MRIEICIAKEKMTKMPTGSVPALQQEMLRRVSKRYDDVDVIIARSGISPCHFLLEYHSIPGRLLGTL